MRRGLVREADVARPAGIEHDQGDRQRLVLARRIRPGVVELVEDVGVDAAGAPLAVVRLGRAVALDGHVVRVDLGPDAIEQDAALAADGLGPGPAGEETRGQLLDEGSADLAADLLAAVGDGQRRREDRLGAGGIAVVRRRLGPEQRREHGPPAVGLGRLAVHDGAREDAFGEGRVGEQVRRARDRRVRLDPGVDHRPGVLRRVLEPHGRSPIASSTTCGNVDSQSIARCGSSIRAISSMARSTAVPASSDASARAAMGGDGIESGAPRVAQVGDVRPLVLDLLAALLEHGVGVKGSVDQVTDRLVGHGRSLRRGECAVRRVEGPGCPEGGGSGGANRATAGASARRRPACSGWAV